MTNPGSTLQTPDVVARYWTEERMRDARPMERGVTTAMAPASPRESGRAPATTPSRIVPARRQSKTKASQATGPEDFTRNPDVGNSTYDGWTQEEMDAAQPLERTVTGGEEGSGAPSDPPGGSVGGGIP